MLPRAGFKSQSREMQVTAGEFNYLAMVIGVFVVFWLSLAYISHKAR